MNDECYNITYNDIYTIRSVPRKNSRCSNPSHNLNEFVPVYYAITRHARMIIKIVKNSQNVIYDWKFYKIRKIFIHVFGLFYYYCLNIKIKCWHRVLNSN